LPIEFLSQRNE